MVSVFFALVVTALAPSPAQGALIQKPVKVKALKGVTVAKVKASQTFLKVATFRHPKKGPLAVWCKGAPKAVCNVTGPGSKDGTEDVQAQSTGVSFGGVGISIGGGGISVSAGGVTITVGTGGGKKTEGSGGAEGGEGTDTDKDNDSDTDTDTDTDG